MFDMSFNFDSTCSNNMTLSHLHFSLASWRCPYSYSYSCPVHVSKAISYTYKYPYFNIHTLDHSKVTDHWLSTQSNLIYANHVPSRPDRPRDPNKPLLSKRYSWQTHYGSKSKASVGAHQNSFRRPCHSIHLTERGRYRHESWSP